MVRIITITSVATIIMLGCYSFYEKKLFDLYSLRCTHVEFDNIEKWFMVKKKLINQQAHAIFEEPWHSKTFDKSTKVKDLSLWGVLTEASATNLFFSQNNYSLIKINRINLNLSIESKGVSLYSCEKKSPDKLYSAIENKLLKLRSNIQI
ncbi:hypothetical protein OA344_02005 [Pseudomonadota bacterium]|nr:hypothetical protein [Pseudomonadota bacterium]